jgi:hypothetical protein
MGGRLRFIFHETAFSKGRDHVFVTPHPSESHPISLDALEVA